MPGEGLSLAGSALAARHDGVGSNAGPHHTAEADVQRLAAQLKNALRDKFQVLVKLQAEEKTRRRLEEKLTKLRTEANAVRETGDKRLQDLSARAETFERRVLELEDQNGKLLEKLQEEQVRGVELREHNRKLVEEKQAEISRAEQASHRETSGQSVIESLRRDLEAAEHRTQLAESRAEKAESSYKELLNSAEQEQNSKVRALEELRQKDQEIYELQTRINELQERIKHEQRLSYSRTEEGLEAKRKLDSSMQEAESLRAHIQRIVAERDRMISVLRERERDLEDLRQKTSELYKACKMEEKNRAAQEERAGELELELKHLREERSKLVRGTEASTSQLHELAKKLDDRESELREQVQKNMDLLRSINDERREHAQSHSDVEHAVRAREEEISRLQERLDDVYTKFEEAQKRAMEADAEARRAAEELQQHQRQAQSIYEDLEREDEQRSHLENLVRTREKELQELRGSLDALEDQFSAEHRSKQKVLDECEALREEVAVLDEVNAKLFTKVQTESMTRQQLQKALDDTQSRVDEAERTMQRLKSEMSDAETQKADAERQVQLLSSEIEQIQEAKQELEESLKGQAEWTVQSDSELRQNEDVIVSLQEEALKLTEKLRRSEASKQEVATILEELQDRIRMQYERNEELRTKLALVDNSKKVALDDVKQRQAEIAELVARQEKLLKVIHDFERERAYSGASMKNIMQDADSLREANDSLKSRLRMTSKEKTKQYVEIKRMEQKMSSVVTGLKQRLKDRERMAAKVLSSNRNLTTEIKTQQLENRRLASRVEQVKAAAMKKQHAVRQYEEQIRELKKRRQAVQFRLQTQEKARTKLDGELSRLKNLYTNQKQRNRELSRKLVEAKEKLQRARGTGATRRAQTANGIASSLRKEPMGPEDFDFEVDMINQRAQSAPVEGKGDIVTSSAPSDALYERLEAAERRVEKERRVASKAIAESKKLAEEVKKLNSECVKLRARVRHEEELHKFAQSKISSLTQTVDDSASKRANIAAKLQVEEKRRKAAEAELSHAKQQLVASQQRCAANISRIGELKRLLDLRKHPVLRNPRIEHDGEADFITTTELNSSENARFGELPPVGARAADDSRAGKQKALRAGSAPPLHGAYAKGSRRSDSRKRERRFARRRASPAAASASHARQSTWAAGNAPPSPSVPLRAQTSLGIRRQKARTETDEISAAEHHDGISTKIDELLDGRKSFQEYKAGLRSLFHYRRQNAEELAEMQEGMKERTKEPTALRVDTKTRASTGHHREKTSGQSPREYTERAEGVACATEDAKEADENRSGPARPAAREELPVDTNLTSKQTNDDDDDDDDDLGVISENHIVKESTETVAVEVPARTQRASDESEAQHTSGEVSAPQNEHAVQPEASDAGGEPTILLRRDAQ